MSRPLSVPVGQLIRRLVGRTQRRKPTDSKAAPAGSASDSSRLVGYYSSRPPRFGRGLDRVVDLLAESVEFGDSLRDCGDVIDARLGWSLDREIRETAAHPAASLADDRIEPTMTAIQIAATDLLRSLGLSPVALLTMSGGEFAAGYASDALRLHEAMELACACGRMHVDRVGAGAMIRLAINAREARDSIQQAPGPVYFACDLDPATSFVSTTVENTERLLAHLQERGIEAFQLPYACGYHCELIAEWENRVGPIADRIGPRSPRLPLYSATAGGRAHVLDANHWKRTIAGPALFLQACSAALNEVGGGILDVNLRCSHSLPVIAIAAKMGCPIEISPFFGAGPLIPHLRSLQAAPQSRAPD